MSTIIYFVRIVGLAGGVGSRKLSIYNKIPVGEYITKESQLLNTVKGGRCQETSSNIKPYREGISNLPVTMCLT